MEELEITKDLIRTLAFYGIVNNWSVEKLKGVYNYLEIPIDLVNETLNEGIE